jgi:hypothetical protein
MQTIGFIVALVSLLIGAALKMTGWQDIRVAALFGALAMLAAIVAVITWGEPTGWELGRRAIAGLCVLVFTVVIAWKPVTCQYAKEQAERQARQYSGKLESLFVAGQTPALDVEVGDSGATIRWEGPEGQAIFKILNNSHLTIERIDGRLVVSTEIWDETGAQIAELYRNEWRVTPPPGIVDRNYTRDMLEIRDRTGDVVLQVRALARKIQLQGKWYDKTGRMVAICVQPQLISLDRSAQNRDRVKIKPAFQYPSERHMGELLNE